jgi:hypothetical protein
VGVRTLGILLALQLALGAALLVWATQGFPLPDAIDGGATTQERSTAQAASGAPRTDRFDGARAFALLREQVEEYGPRPAGSAASRRLARRLRTLLPRGRLEAIPGKAGEVREADTGVVGRPRNVVGRIPGRRPAVVLAAHYDTEATVEGHVGANDGAAGTAAVVEASRALRRAPRPAGAREIRFVLFDGEEEPRETADFYADGLRGSKAYAREHADEIGQLVLLDYIAEARGLSFPREAGSDPELWARLRAAARRVGTLRLFPDRVTGEILDDHTPFTRRGVPAIDLIDFDYPQRDSLDDDLDAVSERSLDAVGETVVELLLDLRRQRADSRSG